MEFGILFTSHANAESEPFPHREVHARVTREIVRADELGFDYAWLAEHHFSDQYGIMPDVFVYAGYLAALTTRIKIGTAVVTLPLSHPVRIAENAAFVDILSGGRFVLGIGSGYRDYEFDGFGVDFARRRDIQEEAIPLLLDLFKTKRAVHHGEHVRVTIDGDNRIFPHAVQEPHPPIFMAGATDRSIGVAARMGFGLLLSSWTPFDGLARQIALYRHELGHTPAELRRNAAYGHADVTRYVYVADTDARAKAESEAVILRHLSHFAGAASGYLGTMNAGTTDYNSLSENIIIHGSPATVIAKIERLRALGANSLMLHYPPWYGTDKAMASLALFAREVMPAFAGKTNADDARHVRTAGG